MMSRRVCTRRALLPTTTNLSSLYTLGSELKAAMSEQAAVGKLVAQADQSGGVLAKLIIFALSLGIVPLSSYFLSRDYLWDGNTIYAAITAIVAANGVLVLYIVEAMREESRLRTREKQESESRKNR
ncbi:hypothetical protein C2E23DRAFT_850562 [Lenzites betulinus]|nr:hypothetical protein C2E23DRAFT_850562 [Lenzites betulinus]